MSKIHKLLSAVPGRPVISNSGASMEKVSEYLDYVFKLIMGDGCSYIKDPSDSLKKLKNIGKLPKELSWLQQMLLYSIPKFQKHLEKQSVRGIHLSYQLRMMVDFVLKNNFFEFNTGS